MKKLILLLVFFTGLAAASAAAYQDTAKTKVVDGKIWARHKVVKGETFYGLAKQYKTTVEKIQTVNNSKSLTLNTFIYLPTGKSAVTNPVTPPVVVVDPPVETPSAYKTHKVVKGETLSGIARKYGVTVDGIKRANGLKDNNIKLGQSLKIPGKTTVVTPTVKVKDTVVEVPNDNVVTPEPEIEKPKPEKPVQEPVIKETEKVNLNDVSNTKVNVTENTTPKVKEVKKEVEEKGSAKVVTEKVDKTKMQVLHPSIPEGNIIVVINPANNKMAYCRVVGKFAPASNDNASILMSPAVSEMLGINSKATSSQVRIVYAL